MLKDMKFIRSLLRLERQPRRVAIADTKQELLIEAGRQQFKKLIDQGISIQMGL